MKGRAGLLALLFLTASVLVFGQDDDQRPGKILISGGFMMGSLFAGGQYDAYESHRDPYSVSGSGAISAALEADLKFYLIQRMGVEVGSDFLGGTTSMAITTQYPNSTSVSTLFAGVVFRPVLIPLGGSTLDFFVGGGANIHSFSYSDQIDGPPPPDVTPQIGFYAKAGASLYFGRPFFVVGEVEYQKLRDTIAPAAAEFDADELNFILRAGIHFD